MKGINITLIFDGKAEAALNFYKSVFGGEFDHIQRLREMPGAPPMSAEEGEKILHGSLPVGASTLMAMDMPQGRGALNTGNNFMACIDTASEAETTNVFNRLAEGGIVTMPLAHQFWGAFFGMVTDKFDVQWMLNYVNQHQE